MPAGDGSGPRGEGPLTGRALGGCAGYGNEGFASSPVRRIGYGFFGWRGGGRGQRNRFYETGLPRLQRYQQYDREPVETDALKRQVQYVADTIEQISHRVNQLLKKEAKGNS